MPASLFYISNSPYYFRGLQTLRSPILYNTRHFLNHSYLLDSRDPLSSFLYPSYPFGAEIEYPAALSDRQAEVLPQITSK